MGLKFFGLPKVKPFHEKPKLNRMNGLKNYEPVLINKIVNG
jgi:hypothetical protein